MMRGALRGLGSKHVGFRRMRHGGPERSGGRDGQFDVKKRGCLGGASAPPEPREGLVSLCVSALIEVKKVQLGSYNQ
jgi:hypothetical protein